MNFFWYVLWFIIAVSLLVTVHEFGHFWVARRLGFKVLRFSVGFGRPLYKRVAGADKVEYVIAAIPLGGYVKLLDEREGPVPHSELDRSFTRRPHWQRILVLAAGPAFNIVFAILVLWGMLWASGVTEVKPVVGDVIQGSVAAQAGLRSGDEILSLDGKPTPGRREVLFGLLDAISDDGRADLSVKSSDGSMREISLFVSDPEERRRLTEADVLLPGLGFEFWRPSTPPILGRVAENGPAAKAGLREGDEVIAINDQPVRQFRDIVGLLPKEPQAITVRYRRDGVENTVQVNVDEVEVNGVRYVGMGVSEPPGYGIPESMFAHTKLSPIAALGRATSEAWEMSVLQIRLFVRMLTGSVSLKNISGPLSIAEFAGESARAGATAFLSFLVLISLWLGILNLLPIPILDGGQIVFQTIEWIKGSPLSERAQVFGQQVGIALLFLLMGVALFNDIARQLS